MEQNTNQGEKWAVKIGHELGTQFSFEEWKSFSVMEKLGSKDTWNRPLLSGSWQALLPSDLFSFSPVLSCSFLEILLSSQWHKDNLFA